jgi:hypothetical protein
LDLRGTFFRVVQALTEEGIAHAFIGALPVLAWGRVRATTDIDLVVLADSWDRLSVALLRHGITQQKQIGPADAEDTLPDVGVFFSTADVPVRVDVFVAKTDFERVVIETAREAPVLGINVQLARPEASIIYKLLAQRRRDLDDIDAIFAARQAVAESLDWQFLETWAEAWGIADRLDPYRRAYGPQN